MDYIYLRSVAEKENPTPPPSLASFLARAAHSDGVSEREGSPSETGPTAENVTQIRAGHPAPHFTPTLTSSLFARISGTYMAAPISGSAWKKPGTSARRV